VTHDRKVVERNISISTKQNDGGEKKKEMIGAKKTSATDRVSGRAP